MPFRGRLRACSSRELPDIPRDIIERKIFSRLPVIKVYAITILSKSFKNSWIFCHDISLDRDFSLRVSSEQYKVLVGDIISGHSGVDARTFLLYFNPIGNEELVKTWLHKLDTLGFREIYIYFSVRKLAMAVPSSLMLRSCNLSLSGSHPQLLNLTLQGITISQELIDGIFTVCNSLRSLKLIDCENKGGPLQIGAQSSEGLREIMFEQYGSGKTLHSIFINGPPSLNHLSFSKDNFTVMLQMVPPRLGDASIVHMYNSLLNNVDTRLWECSEVSSGCLLLPNFSIKGVIPITDIPIEPAEEYHVNFRLWEARRFHIHFPLWNVEEFHFHAKNHFVDYLDIVMFLPRCRMIKKVSLDFEGGPEIIDSKVTYESVSMAIHMSIKFEHLQYVKISGVQHNVHHILLVKFFAKTAKRCLRDFILIKGNGSKYTFPPEWPWIHCFEYGSFPMT